MHQDMIEATLVFFGFALLLLSPLIVYRLYFKKRTERTGGDHRNFSLSDENIDLFVSTLESYGFTLCDPNDPLLNLHEEHQSAMHTTIKMLFRKDAKGFPTYIGLTKFETHRAGGYEAFVAKNLIYIGELEDNREAVDVLPSGIIRPYGIKFGHKEDGSLVNTSPIAERYKKQAFMYSKNKQEELKVLTDSPDFQEGVIKAFDRHVHDIKIQTDGNGVSFRYLKLDFEDWDKERVEDLVSAIESITHSFPPVRRVQFARGLPIKMLWSYIFICVAFILAFITMKEAEDYQCLQPDSYRLVQIPVILTVIVALIKTWPKAYFSTGTGCFMIITNLVMSIAMSVSLEFVINRFGVESQRLTVPVDSKEIVVDALQRHRIYFTPPNGEPTKPYVDVGKPIYDKLSEDHYGEITYVMGRFGLSFYKEAVLKKKKNTE